MRAQPMASKCLVRDELEYVILVDAENKAIGSCGKINAHRDGKLHRAFSLLITNPDGELLLQQRSASKYHFAQRWSNTCCVHPRPGEQILAAARRRLGEELGFSVPLEEVTDLQYRVRDPDSSLIEHEYLHVFLGRYSGEPNPNPDEVSAYRWMLPTRVQRSLALCTDFFTPRFVLLATMLAQNDGIGHRSFAVQP